MTHSAFVFVTDEFLQCTYLVILFEIRFCVSNLAVAAASGARGLEFAEKMCHEE
jgi:hypothetical protein